MEDTGRWPFWVAGLCIGLLVTAFAWIAGKGFGVSSGYGTLCSLVSSSPFFKRKPFNERWRLLFLIGFPLGGLIATALNGDVRLQTQIGSFETVFGSNPVVRAAVLLAGGFLVGWGARAAGGCTSGHSILGIAQGSRASLVATIGFMAAGILVTNLLFGFFGGR
jgi:uncharacterized membrane protein YedE/YeeE